MPDLAEEIYQLLLDRCKAAKDWKEVIALQRQAVIGLGVALGSAHASCGKVERHAYLALMIHDLMEAVDKAHDAAQPAVAQWMLDQALAKKP